MGIKGLVADTIPFSNVDGPGNRFVVFLQGCNFDCIACHNPQTIPTATGDHFVTDLDDLLAGIRRAARSTAAERLLARATTAQAVLGRAPSWQEAAQAYIAAFEETLHLSLQPAELTPIELEEAARLADEKFAHPSWTERI